MANPTIVASAAAPGNPTTGWTQTLSASIALDDWVFVVVESRGNTASRPTVSDNGGGSAYALVAGSTDNKFSVFRKKAVAGTAGATLTVTGAVQVTAGGYFAIRGADATTPTTNVSMEEDNNASHAGFTPDTADSLIVLAIGNTWSDLVTVATCTNPGTMEPELFQHVSSPGNRALAWASVKAQSGGPSATGTFTWTLVPDVIRSIVFAIQPTASGLPEITGDSTQALLFGGSAQATVSVAGTSTQALTLGGSAAGVVSTEGTSTRSLTFGGSAAATVSTVGTSTRSLTVGGSAAATLSIEATSTRTLVVAGSAAAALSIDGESTEALLFGGSAEGAVGDESVGSSTQSLVITGTAEADVSIQGQSTRPLLFGGSAAGAVSLEAQSIAALIFGGSGRGFTTLTGQSDEQLRFGGSALGSIGVIPEGWITAEVSQSPTVIARLSQAPSVIARLKANRP